MKTAFVSAALLGTLFSLPVVAQAPAPATEAGRTDRARAGAPPAGTAARAAPSTATERTDAAHRR